MKLEALFKSENNKLFTVDGKEIVLENLPVVSAAECNASAPLPESEFSFVEFSWSLTGKDEESYNEAFLADFRDWLKLLDENKKFVILRPESEKELSDSEKAAYIASMKHCARRVKDCVSVIGFALPDCVNARNFIEEIYPKHKHYVYFSADASVLSDGAIVGM